MFLKYICAASLAVVFASSTPAHAGSLEEAVAAESSASVELNNEMNCLAEAVYNESGAEPIQGKMAVARVIINRKESGQFPNSLCGVVNQKGQFTYQRGRGIRKGGEKQWADAKAVARIATKGLFADVAKEALFFHNTRVNPRWRGMKRIAQIGAHIFYKKS